MGGRKTIYNQWGNSIKKKHNFIFRALNAVKKWLTFRVGKPIMDMLSIWKSYYNRGLKLRNDYDLLTSRQSIRREVRRDRPSRPQCCRTQRIQRDTAACLATLKHKSVLPNTADTEVIKYLTGNSEDKITGVYKVATNLISFPPPFFNLISMPRPPYSGGGKGPGGPLEIFFENVLLKRALLGHFSAFQLKASWVRTPCAPPRTAPEIVISWIFFLKLNFKIFCFIIFLDLRWGL